MHTARVASVAMETSPERPVPVRALNQMIAGWIDRLGAVWVEGQVTNVSRPAGNNVYLTLRDKLAEVSIKAYAPRAVIDALPAPPMAGSQIIINARPTFWLNRGDLSLEVRAIRLAGEGELLARLEQRRQLLAAEGLFDSALKRPLPFLPRSVGLVTAKDSAAERDVLENARRRWPGVRFTVRHATVQGLNAAREVIEACAALERLTDVEVVVIARGGGSLEDLLPFSDEALIRQVHSMRTPVVSAIGHEQDTPLLDLVADVRASTPTDAAKLVAPDVAAEAERVAQVRMRARRVMLHLLDREQHALAALRARPVLADPRASLEVHLREVRELRERGRRRLDRDLTAMNADLDLQLARVRALSPLSTLNRGYAIVADAQGVALTSVTDVGAGDAVHIRLADGRISATTDEVHPLDHPADPEESSDD